MGSTDRFSIRDMQERKRRMGSVAPLPETPSARPVPPAALPPATPAAAALSGPGAADAGEERIDLVAYWEAIVRQRKWILACLVVGASLGAYLAYSQSVLYRATGTFTLERGSPELNQMDKELAWYLGDTFLKDAREIESRAVLKTASTLLPSEVDLLGQDSTEADRGFAAKADWRAIQGALLVTPAEKERFVTVEATSASPVLAAALVNAAMKAYQLEDIQALQTRAASLDLNLGRAIDEKRKEVAELEQRIVNEEAHLARAGGGANPLDAEEQSRLRIMEQYILRRSEVEIELQGLETQIARWRDLIEEEAAQAAPPSDELRAKDRFAQRVQELQIKREELLVRYTPENPKVQEIEAEIRKILELREAEIAGSLSRPEEPERLRDLRQELVRAEMRRVDLEKKLERYDQEIMNRTQAMTAAANARFPLESLRAQKQVLNQIIYDFAVRQAQASIEKDVGESKVKILENAIPPLAPVEAGGHRPLLLWIAGSLVLGIGLSLFIDSLSRTVKGPATIRKELGLRTLGFLPILSDVERERYIDPTKPTSLLAESFGVLRNNIRFGQTGNFEKLLLVTSPLPEEGKSFVSANLAISFTLEGNRVILIDGDLRKSRSSSFHEAVGAAPASVPNGLTQYLLTPEIRFSDIVLPTSMPDLHWIPGGARPDNPAQALRSPKLAELFAHVQRYFDIAIVDSPALLPVADTAQIATHVQGVVLVLSNEQTSINAAIQAADRLRHVGSRVVGVILNRTHRFFSSHYYGYSRYSYRYEDEGT